MAALPMTRANLELVRDALSSGDADRIARGLHFIGRTVDVAPAAASSLGTNALPISLPPITDEHRNDLVYMSLFERVVAALLHVVLSAAGANDAGTADAPPPKVDGVQLQTVLSVLRKLFRNAPSYMIPSSGSVLLALLQSLRHAPRELCVVIERSLDECLEKLPASIALVHAVANVVEVAAVEESVVVQVAALRALSKLVPRIPAHLVLAELDKGPLMEAAAKLFLSQSTDVRRTVVQLHVALHAVVGEHLTRFMETYLSVPQQKLIAIYIHKENSSAATAAPAAVAPATRYR